jgi:hypothetical protein
VGQVQTATAYLKVGIASIRIPLQVSVCPIMQNFHYYRESLIKESEYQRTQATSTKRGLDLTKPYI